MTEKNLNASEALEKSIMEVMVRNPKGVSQKTLQTTIPDMTVLVCVLNKLVKQDRISLLKKGNQLVYVWKPESSSKKFLGSDVEEKVIFEGVKRAGNNGTSARDLKFACNMPQGQITKILKSLEIKRVVKQVTSHTKRKVYMLYELEPSHTVTGGTFYNNQEFETDFVDALGQLCCQYLQKVKSAAENLIDPLVQRQASYKSSKEILEYITSTGISKVQLKVSDIEQILESAIYDGKIEKKICISKATGTETYYSVTKPLLANVGLMRMPCGVCLVYEDCGKGRDVSPSTCIYMKEWLDF